MSLQESTKKRRILPAASDELHHTIYVFLSRDDNSSLCPAKAASTRCEEGRKQNRILSDYVYAMHHINKASEIAIDHLQKSWNLGETSEACEDYQSG